MSKQLEPHGIKLGLRSDDWDIRRMHVVPTNLPVSHIPCREPWSKLSETQKHFVHHFARASWSGSRICARQISEESPDILRLLMLLLSSTEVSDLKRRCHVARVTPEEWDFFIAYAICFLTNMGNYLAFGDMKIVPGIPEHQLEVIVGVCPLQVIRHGTSGYIKGLFTMLKQSHHHGEYGCFLRQRRYLNGSEFKVHSSDVFEVIDSYRDLDERKRRLLDLWEKTRKRIYSLSPGERHLGMPPDGVSAYYSEDMTMEEVQLVSDMMKEVGIEPWNTRIWRRSGRGENGEIPEYDLRIASAKCLPTRTYYFENKCTIHVVFGDFKDDLKEVVMHLKNALPYADTDEQREIVTCFIDYLETGSIESHKRSQVLWLNQKEPSIDVNIGFVETYRDPHGSRAEFEGYVATINKAASKQFLALTERADKLLALLPWPKEFHGEKFQCPDFTCFEIVVYANGTIPTGINLPNYEDVREAHGSKNICLSNVLNSEDYRTQTSFLLDEDVQILKRTKGEVFLIHLACHELLGHGSGKLFTKSKEGEYNFPHGKIRHPFTGEPVINCYGPGDTWNSVFENISSAFEECRAECVGLFFSTLPEALETFGHTGQYAEDLMYLNWLIMVRAGFLAIEFYSEDKGHWRQAHMQARFAILRTLLSASERDAEEVLAKGTRESAQGSEFLKIEHRRNRSAVIRLNRKKIRSVGLPAIRELLMKLQVYRSTADAEKGREFFTELTTIPRNLMEWRRIVLANKRARPICVQVHTRLIEDNDGESHVIMEEFPATPLGIIESHVARFKNWAFEC